MLIKKIRRVKILKIIYNTIFLFTFLNKSMKYFVTLSNNHLLKHVFS
jgi:hypothetical protein